MGNTISEDLEPNDYWWPQTTQTQTREHTTRNVNVSMPSSSFTLEDLQNIQIPKETSSTETVEQTECTRLRESLSEKRAIVFSPESIARRKVNEEKMEEFRAELAMKHLARRQAIAERSKEILFLREELAKYKKENEELRETLKVKNEESINYVVTEVEDTSWKQELEQLKTENEILNDRITKQQEEIDNNKELQQQNHDLRLNIAEVQNELQSVNSQVIEFEKERQDYQTHVSAMKEVVAVSKQLLEIREKQLEELRAKVAEIESNISEQETSMLATNLRNEYEKQLRNMRALRTLYEERQAATKADRDAIAKELEEMKKQLEGEQSKVKECEERIEELEKDVSDKYDKVQSLESQLGLSKAECRELQAEMSVINQLFSQILIGFNNGQMDLDKLIKLLEENHDLLTDIVVNEESIEHSSALPKTLLDLVNQVQEQKKISDEDTVDDISSCEGATAVVTSQCEDLQLEQQSSNNQMCSAAEIVHNLPKVWRVLAELLSQQSGQQPVVIEDTGMDPCYKSIETPKGPKVVLSVSQTFIRLKDLILEKKSLEKEMTRLKHLNTHLELRLQDQEKRLETVSTELSKTWHVVGRMQRQHQQLHTHEKILRYELAQKRKMLTELKQELEYCREKWEQAREKNSNTEEQWKKLRNEFASRKNTNLDDLNNSAESGYSDDREGSSDEDVSFGSKKKNNDPITSPIKGETDTEDNDEISHESDTDDILESAFNKACSLTTQQPQLTISEVLLPDSEVLPSTSTNENTSNSNTELKYCDMKVETKKIIEDAKSEYCSNELHSDESCKTDNKVQINDSLTQVQTNVLTELQTENISSNDDIENDSNNNCFISPNNIADNFIVEQPKRKQKLSQSELFEIIMKIDFSLIKIPFYVTRVLQKENKLTVTQNTIDTPDIPPPPPLPPLSLYASTDTRIIQKTDNKETAPTPSSSCVDVKQMTNEERLSRREERLRRLEEQCKQLVKKVTNTTNRGVEICSRLETLHEQYGSTTEPENQIELRQNETEHTENRLRNTEQNEENSENNTRQQNEPRVRQRSRNTDNNSTNEESTQNENNT